jgi:uncharacterized protein (TIGR03435 family)
MKKNAVLLVLAVSVLSGQSPTWKEFSIGPPTRNQSGFNASGIRAEGVPLKRALARAYGLPEHRIIGPGWIGTERYAIVGQVSDPKDFQPLFQQELTNRFQMTAHRETKEVPVYVLKTMEGGKPPLSGGGTEQKRMGQGLKMTGVNVGRFASELADYIEKPVFDETGMDGKFDFSLFWTGGNGAALQAAVKDQLGLQLVDDRRVLDILIIDHIEKPQFSK